MLGGAPASEMIRTVHLIFISCSILLALFVAAWAFVRFQEGAPVSYAVGAAGALAAASVLVVYGLRFRRRSRYW
jgi:hypothetical protein